MVVLFLILRTLLLHLSLPILTIKQMDSTYLCRKQKLSFLRQVDIHTCINMYNVSF
ncbi:hypothetical protein GLYMA_12G097950v4 [Glycine max]|nr:hypothetical protein GLYMA_12G097950v4 [Glycine max]KAH1142450.1 hypothetical protein GYH30_033237 [Glycine max]